MIDLNSSITLETYATFFDERKCFSIPNDFVGLSDADIFLLTQIGLPSRLVNDYLVVDSLELSESKIILARDSFLSDNCIYFDLNIDRHKLFFDSSEVLFSYTLKQGMLATLIYHLFYEVYNPMCKERYTQKSSSQLTKQYFEKYEFLFELTKSKFDDIDENSFTMNHYWRIWKTIVEEDIELEKSSALRLGFL